MFVCEQIQYYTRRESEERASAADAATGTLAKLHIEIAEAYARIVARYEQTLPPSP